MKKFVTIVLALALVLSLCTVAFAAKEYKNLYWFDGDTWVKYDVDDADISYTEESVTKKDGKVVGGSLAFYEIWGDEYVVCDKDDAEVRLDVDGKTVYLAYAEYGVDYNCLGKEVKSGTKCDEFDFEDVYDKIFVDADDVYYAVDESSEDVMLAGGKVYPVAEVEDFEETYKVPHTWKTVSGELTVDLEDEELKSLKGELVCKECGKKGTITKKYSDIPSGAESFCVSEEIGVWVYWTNAAADAKAEGVESSKTFDAGVAMYVGLSLASVTGSAVVIGKKKEF